MSDEKQTRTCPPSTPVAELSPGDRVMYQTERMAEEAEGVIASIGGEFGVDLITLEDGRSFPAGVAWIVKTGKGTTPPCPAAVEPIPPDEPRQQVCSDEDKRAVVMTVAGLIVEGATVHTAIETTRETLNVKFPMSAFYRWRKQFRDTWQQITGKSADEHVRRVIPPPRRKAPPAAEPPQEPCTSAAEKRTGGGSDLIENNLDKMPMPTPETPVADEPAEQPAERSWWPTELAHRLEELTVEMIDRLRECDRTMARAATATGRWHGRPRRSTRWRADRWHG